MCIRDREKDAVKKTVSLLPMTFAAVEGADGRSLIVLVRDVYKRQPLLLTFFPNSSSITEKIILK